MALLGAFVPLAAMLAILLAAGSVVMATTGSGTGMGSADGPGAGLVDAPGADVGADPVGFAFAYLVLAVGGKLRATSAAAELYSSQQQIGFMPMLPTLAGFGLMMVVLTRRWRRDATAATSVVLIDAARVIVLFVAAVGVIAVFTRYETRADGRLRAEVGPTVVRALAWTTTTIVSSVVLVTATRTKAWTRRIVSAARGPAIALGVVIAGTIAISSVWTAVEVSRLDHAGTSPKIAAFAVLALFLPNLAVNATVLSMGVPLTVSSGAGTATYSLTDLLDLGGWYWLLPVSLGLLLVSVVIGMAVRARTMAAALRGCVVFTGGLAVGLLLACAAVARPEVGPLSYTAPGRTSFGAAVGPAVLWGLGASVMGLAVALPAGHERRVPEDA
ncbi:hypothetical protein [Frankia sp. Cppng1_Ct_nod]|uniref:hypothetical protein n=1 Tax=Frankia sp. Cppng1_Ct_nod TaxID=2897162 RepID=UPI001040E897|nr:hypothetical protein [Frankia sp. Cppng1_Ct_nod]